MAGALGAVPSMVGSPTLTTLANEYVGVVPTLVVDVANKAIVVQVSPGLAPPRTTIRWVAGVDLSYVYLRP